MVKYLCYDLEACFLKKGCKRGDTKILEIAFTSGVKSYQRLVNPLTKYQNGKEVINSLNTLNQHVENTLNFWVKLLIGKKALPSEVKRKSIVEKAEHISTLLIRSDEALKHDNPNGIMQALARNKDNIEEAKNDIRMNDDSFNQIFYTPDAAIKGMLKEAEGIDVWCAHNGKSFDEKVLRGHDHNFDHVVFVDSLQILKYLLPGLTSYSQPLIYKHLFKNKYFAHHALEDAVALAKIMKYVLKDKCILKTKQLYVKETEEKGKAKKLKPKRQVKVFPESTLYKLKGIGPKTVEKLYKKDIKSREDLIRLLNIISFDTWCDNYSFVHNYKKIYETYKGSSFNVAVV